MWKDVEEAKRHLGIDYLDNKRNAIRVDWMEYMDELAGCVGCRPNIGKYVCIVNVDQNKIFAIDLYICIHFFHFL